jgi:rhodanese-related sulfurtransferase
VRDSSRRNDVTVPTIDVTELAGLPPGSVVVDVREPEEYVEGHVPGARLIPLGEVVERVDEFPTDTTVYVICQMGSRSAKATGFLLGQGVDAVNVAGGTGAWIAAGEPVVTGEAAD